jgi:uncharacterized protein (TIGR03435 family)
MTLSSLSLMCASVVSALGNHLWQSTIFAGAVALLSLTLRKYQARWRYGLWLTASAKFLIPFSLLIGVGSHLRWTAPQQRSTPDMYVTLNEMGQPFTGASVLRTPMHAAAMQPAMVHPSAASLPELLAAIWLCGFIAVLAYWYVQWRRISTLVREAKPLPEGREVEMLRRMEQLAGLPNRIEMLLSASAMEPGIFGMVRPVLLWPEGISRHLDDAHLDAVLAHEVAHVQRRDNLTCALHMLVEAIFWFHPVVWWLEKRLVEERERACDEEVVRIGKQPQVYAESILKVCEFCVEAPLSCVSGITGADLKKRIVQIMTERVARNLDFSKKLLLAGVALLAVCVPIVFGQVVAKQGASLTAATSAEHARGDIAGNWQGTLPAEKSLRIVVKIAKADKGWSATMYSIDQGAYPIKTTSITLDGSTLKYAVDLIGGNYEGTLSADGNSIVGTWTQGPKPLPLTLVRATKETAWEIPAPPPPPKLMAADADPSFDVATIKPNDSGKPNMFGLKVQGRNFRAVNASLGDLIAFAFDVQAKQIVGGPDWINKDRYDIAGVPDKEGTPNVNQLQSMMRKLLADRFKLTYHNEKRELSAYVLTVGKNGPKLKPTQLNGPLPGLGMRPGPGGLTLMVINAKMTDFTGFMQMLVLDRPVVDRTGLDGKFDFQCKFTPDDSQFNGHPPPLPKQADDAEIAPNLFEALQQQDGLKLAAEKTPVEVIAIDHVEKPSAN